MLIDSDELIRWLNERIDEEQRDVDHYKQAGDRDEADRREYFVVAYRKVIDKITRKIR